MFQKRTSAIIVLILIAIFGTTIGGCGGNSEEDKDAPEQQVIEVERGKLETIVSAFGHTSMPGQSRLSFGLSGTIDELDVEFGDRVSEGDLLARLDVEVLQRAVKAAEIDLRGAEVNLEQANRDIIILEAEAAVESAAASLAAAELACEQAMEYNVSDAETGVNTARSQLESTEKIAAMAIDQAEGRLMSAWESWDTYVTEQGSGLPQNEVTLLGHEEQMLEEINASLGNLQTARANPGTIIAELEAGIETAKEELSSIPVDEPVMRKVEANIYKARNELAYIKDGYNFWDQASNDPQIDTIKSLDRIERGFKDARNSLGDLVQQHIDSLLMDHDLSNQEEELLAAIKNAAMYLQVSERQANASTASAEADLSAAEKSLEAASVDIREKESAVSGAKANLARTENELANARDGLNIETLELAADKARLALEDARARLEDGMITAPFDGTVARTDARVGDQVMANTPIIHLVDTSSVEIDASVDEIDVADVQAGQEAEIFFDSMPGVMLSGKVTAVSPVAEKISGLVTYGLKVEIEDSEGVNLKEGMTASVDIRAVLAEDALLVPNAAIEKLGDTGVEVVTLIGDNGLRREQMVETGQSNGRYTEILNGLEEGDRIVAGAGIQMDENMMECIERLLNDPCVEKLMKMAEEYGIDIPGGSGGFGNFGELKGE